MTGLVAEMSAESGPEAAATGSTATIAQTYTSNYMHMHISIHMCSADSAAWHCQLIRDPTKFFRCASLRQNAAACPALPPHQPHTRLPSLAVTVAMPAYEINPLCPPSAPFFGFMGAAVALIFASACPPSSPPLSPARRPG